MVYREFDGLDKHGSYGDFMGGPDHDRGDHQQQREFQPSIFPKDKYRALSSGSQL
jgi:hypothetical protein